MKIKNISVGDSVQIKKGKHLDYFKDDEICQVIDIDAGDKYGFDVLIDGQKGLDWVNHKYLKKPEPQLKQLDQSVFDGLDKKWRFAAVDANGRRKSFKEKPYIKNGEWLSTYTLHCNLGLSYDTSNWQNSLIERDIAKEPAEVDLSIELTGSELCKAMLARGDKYVMCAVSDDGQEDTLLDGYYSVIQSVEIIQSVESSLEFYGYDKYWRYVTPINNQGEPLTASEVGL